MIRTIQHRRIPITQPRPTTIAGIEPAGCPGLAGCGDCTACSRRPAVGELKIGPFDFSAVKWQTWAMVAALAYILIREFWFTDKRKARGKKVSQARADYKRRLAKIRKGEDE